MITGGCRTLGGSRNRIASSERAPWSFGWCVVATEQANKWRNNYLLDLAANFCARGSLSISGIARAEGEYFATLWKEPGKQQPSREGRVLPVTA